MTVSNFITLTCTTNGRHKVSIDHIVAYSCAMDGYSRHNGANTLLLLSTGGTLYISETEQEVSARVEAARQTLYVKFNNEPDEDRRGG